MEVDKEPRSLPVQLFTTETPWCFIIKVVEAPGFGPVFIIYLFLVLGWYYEVWYEKQTCDVVALLYSK